MKRSSWKKFFTRSRSKSASRSKKGPSLSESPNQNATLSSLAIEDNEPIVQKVVAEKPLEAEVIIPVADAVQDTGPSLKQAGRMNSSTSQPRSSTNEDFMAEEVESQNSSINSQASEKPATVTDLDFVQDVGQADSAVMVRHPAFSESVPSNDVVDSAQTTNEASATDPDAVGGTENTSELVNMHAGNQEKQADSPSKVLKIEDPDPENAIADTHEEIEVAPREITHITHEQVEDENPRTTSDDEAVFAVDRSQPQQLSKLDVLGPDLQINPNYSESDDSQKPPEHTYDITNNFVTTNYKLSDPSEPESQKCEFTLRDKDTNSGSDTAAIVLELPHQLLHKDECPTRGAESLRGAEMLFFSGVTDSGVGQGNFTPILFFGPQDDNFVEQKIVYQVANDRHAAEDDNNANQADLPGNRRGNDGQSPPTLEDEHEDEYSFKNIVKKIIVELLRSYDRTVYPTEVECFSIFEEIQIAVHIPDEQYGIDQLPIPTATLRLRQPHSSKMLFIYVNLQVSQYKSKNINQASAIEPDTANVDRIQPQQLFKLDVPGPYLKIHPNCSDFDDSEVFFF